VPSELVAPQSRTLSNPSLRPPRSGSMNMRVLQGANRHKNHVVAPHGDLMCGGCCYSSGFVRSFCTASSLLRVANGVIRPDFIGKACPLVCWQEAGNVSYMPVGRRYGHSPNAGSEPRNGDRASVVIAGENVLPLHLHGPEPAHFGAD